jgi:hypothetical protein
MSVDDELTFYFPKKKPNYFQNGNHQYPLKFALKIVSVSFLNMAMALSAERITAYVCMNPRCAQSFSNLNSYSTKHSCAEQLRFAPRSCAKHGDLVCKPQCGNKSDVFA